MKDSLLVVDDDQHVGEVIRLHTQQEGYAVTLCSNGKEALEAVESAEFDLVLLDIDMDGMDGLETLKAIRALWSSAKLPVIMVTGRSRSQDTVEALALGANDFVPKPIDFPVLLARVQTQLRIKKVLNESEERYSLAARGANDGLWDWNLQTNRILFSPRWKSLLGCEEDEVGMSPEEWFKRVHPDDIALLKSVVDAQIQGKAVNHECQHRMSHKDGTYRWMLSRGLVVRDAQGRATRMAGSHTDITEGKVADALTGLPNRALFMDRLDRSIQRAKRHKTSLFAVLFLDLDRFKLINDRFGHEKGDQLLIAVARRLETCLRKADTVARVGREHVVARLGGDEFTILLDNIKDINEAKLVAERILKEMTIPFNLKGHELHASASIGIAVNATGYDRAEDILRDADTAMYRSKALGKARCEVFDTAMLNFELNSSQLESDLRQALDRGELLVYYQPIVCLGTGRLSGFEALARWRHPTRGLLLPTEFIPLAEETGLISPIGWWVIEEACRQMKSWQGQFSTQSTMVISVNLSSGMFQQKDLVEQISRVLNGSGLEAQCLKLEITESMAIENPEAVRNILMQLRVMNVQLGFDDFGTGYSSLSYLQQFPVNTLKIDRSFINRLEAGTEKIEIVRAIISLAHGLGLDVVAEGVETARQLELLQSMGCELGQGFLFSKPLDSEASTDLINQQGAATRGLFRGSPAGSPVFPTPEGGSEGLRVHRVTESVCTEAVDLCLPAPTNGSKPVPESVGLEHGFEQNGPNSAARFKRERLRAVLLVAALALGLLFGARLLLFPHQPLSEVPAPQSVVSANELTAPPKEASSSQRDSLPLWIQEAEAAMASGRYVTPIHGNAVAYCDRALQVDPTSQKAKDLRNESLRKAMAQAKELAHAGKFDQARELLLDLHELSRKETRVPFNVGEAKGELKKLEMGTYPVSHEHVLGRCRGELRFNSYVFIFEPAGNPKDRFVEDLAKVSVQASKDKLGIQVRGKTYWFKSDAGKDKEANRRTIQDLYLRLKSASALLLKPQIKPSSR